MGPVERPWWQSAIVYQIYSRSFQDTDGDGVGDLKGIIDRLRYLDWLGVDAIWISPVYPSPMADFGYDVADYCGIDPQFGSLRDFDELVKQLHRRDMKLVLDFVPNHSSDRHPWFLESKSSRTNGKRDWYVWRDSAADGGPPNNWLSPFGGPAWTFDPNTNQYYLHSFLREQPDLNWRNPNIREAMFDVLRFWLDRGVDGFRVDVIWLLIKDDQFRDNPPNPAYLPMQSDINRTLPVYNADRPEIHRLIAQMRSVLDAYRDRVLIGEIYLPFNRLVTYYGESLLGAQLPFNFALIHAVWNAKAIGDLVLEYEGALPAGGWPNWVLGNHDQQRIAARIGEAQARIAAMLLLTLRGTPTMYYGDEIGMAQTEVPRELTKDSWEKNEPGLGVSRDPSRTPLQWDTSPNAGFSITTPWLPIAPDYKERNISLMHRDPYSILSLYRRLIELRQTHAALRLGNIANIAAVNNVPIYERHTEGQRITVVLNFSSDAQALPASAIGDQTILLSTHMDQNKRTPPDKLRPNEGLLLL